MMARFKSVLCVMVAVLLWSMPAMASENPMAGIEIVSIKQMQVRQNSKGYYYLDIMVNMRNGSDSNIRLKDNDFRLAIGAERSGEDAIASRYIGNAAPDTIELKKVASAADPSQPVQFIVGLGSENKDVLSKLAFVMNIVGNPTNKVTIAISGKTKTWKQVKNGWVSPGLMEMELVYRPKVQREVLIE